MCKHMNVELSDPAMSWTEIRPGVQTRTDGELSVILKNDLYFNRQHFQ